MLAEQFLQNYLGRQAHWDIRNEKYLARDKAPIDAAYRAREVMGLKDKYPATALQVPRKRRAWRHMWKDNGQNGPKCTAYGSLTAIHCLSIVHHPLPYLNPDVLYEENREWDRQQYNLHFSEGATTNAALGNLKKHGLIDGFFWLESMDELLDHLVADGVIIVGSDWPWSWFDKDENDAVKYIPEYGIAGGHLYCFNGYYPHTNQLRIPQTWKDGYYFVDVDDANEVIFNRGGEAALIHEVRTPL